MAKGSQCQERYDHEISPRQSRILDQRWSEPGSGISGAPPTEIGPSGLDG